MCSKATALEINKKPATIFNIDKMRAGVASFGKLGCCEIKSSINLYNVTFDDIKILIELRKNKLHKNKLT